MNSQQIDYLHDEDDDQHLKHGVYKFNSLTMMPDTNMEPDGGSVSQKPNFDSIGTFKGIRGLSKDLKGIKDLVNLPSDDYDDEELA